VSNPIDPKSFTPSSGSSTYGWLKRDLDQKADKDWVEAKLETLRDKEEDTKQIAIRAKEKASQPHDCNQKDTLEKLGSNMEDWSKWLRGLLASAIGFLILVGSGWLYQYFLLTSKVENTQEALVSIESKIMKVDESQKELKTSIEKQNKKEEDSQKLRLEEVRAVMIQVVKDINQTADIRDLKRGRQ